MWTELRTLFLKPTNIFERLNWFLYTSIHIFQHKLTHEWSNSRPTYILYYTLHSLYSHVFNYNSNLNQLNHIQAQRFYEMSTVTCYHCKTQYTPAREHPHTVYDAKSFCSYHNHFSCETWKYFTIWTEKYSSRHTRKLYTNTHTRTRAHVYIHGYIHTHIHM